MNERGCRIVQTVRPGNRFRKDRESHVHPVEIWSCLSFV